MSQFQPLLLALASTLVCLAITKADDKEKVAPQIQALVDYFGKNGIKLEKAKDWGWHVVEPKLEGYYVLVNLKSFPEGMTEEAMQKALRPIALAHRLNAPARLAMSVPGLRADAPGDPPNPPPDLKKVPVIAKLEKLFKEYRPEETKK